MPPVIRSAAILASMFVCSISCAATASGTAAMPQATWREPLLAGIISCLATGLGAIPVLFFKSTSRAAVGLLYAAAAGFMMSASVFSIAAEGLHLGGPWQVASGFLAGGFFLMAAAQLMPHGEHASAPSPARHNSSEVATGTQPYRSGQRSLLVLLALFVHSIPEGIAIGVGFATGKASFGLILAIAISFHNIPEGTAMSLPMRDEGASFWRCFWYSVFISLPQALLALPAFWFVQYFHGILPAALAFAGGAMIFLVVFDLLPESYESCKSRTAVAWAFLLGLTTMMLLTAGIEHFSIAG